MIEAKIKDVLEAARLWNKQAYLHESSSGAERILHRAVVNLDRKEPITAETPTVWCSKCNMIHPVGVMTLL